MTASAPPRLPGLAWLLIGLELAVLALTAPLYSLAGLSVDLSTAGAQLAVTGLAAIGAFSMRKDRDGMAETLLALVLLLTCSGIIGAAQYLAAAWNRPLIDPYLARADALLGVSVPALTEWTGRHHWIRTMLTWAYGSLLPQFVLPIFVLGAVERDGRALWEYLFHFHFCAIVTALGLALWPAACVFSYTGTPSLLDQGRFIRHFEGLRAGTLTVVRFTDIEGLVSCPSFHIAGAWMVTWAFRKRPLMLTFLLPLNVALCASTVLLGAHYAVDLFVTALLCVASVAIYRRLPEPFRQDRESSRRQRAAAVPTVAGRS